MRSILVAVAIVSLLGLPLAEPGHAEVNVDINVGIPLPVPPPLVLPAPPEFIFPSALGFYVAVDVPYDLFREGNTYYLYRDNAWYRGPYYNGPWRHVPHRQLPPGLRRHKYEQIRHYRDEEYRRYQGGHDQYRGRRFKPDKEWKEGRKEQRREEKDRRKGERRFEKEERKQDKQDSRFEKEDRQRDRGEGRGQGRHGGRDD